MLQTPVSGACSTTLVAYKHNTNGCPFRGSEGQGLDASHILEPWERARAEGKGVNDNAGRLTYGAP